MQVEKEDIRYHETLTESTGDVLNDEPFPLEQIHRCSFLREGTDLVVNFFKIFVFFAICKALEVKGHPNMTIQVEAKEDDGDEAMKFHVVLPDPCHITNTDYALGWERAQGYLDHNGKKSFMAQPA